MSRGRSRRAMVRGHDGRRRPDRVAVEEPLEIRLDDHLVTTTMRTPGHDFELGAGFLHAEGLLGGQPVRQVRYCATGPAAETGFNVVTVETGGLAPVPAARLTTTTSSCGWCGSAAVGGLLDRLAPITGPAPEADAALLADVAARARAEQSLFEATGAVHAATAFELATGAVEVVREDVGRHNAVDKVVGRLLLDGRLPAASLGLLVSGRTSFEIVQKAWSAGFPLVAGVSAASSLAVDAARQAGITLVGFVRDGGMTVYEP
jgi:FdhD protein